jgi:hypothetical protein
LVKAVAAAASPNGETTARKAAYIGATYHGGKSSVISTFAGMPNLNRHARPIWSTTGLHLRESEIGWLFARRCLK